MLQLDFVVSPAAYDVEKLLEVQALTKIDDIKDRIRVPLLQTIADRCQVSRRVGVGAVTLLNKGRRFLRTEKDNDRSFAFLGDAALTQFAHHVGQHRLIE